MENINIPPKTLIQKYSERRLIRGTQKYSQMRQLWVKSKANLSSKVGSVIKELQKLPKDATIETWEDFYFNNVRSYEQVYHQAVDFSRLAGCSVAYGINYWISHVLDESYEGWVDENKIIDIVAQQVEGKGYSVRHATEEEDRFYAIDFVVINAWEEVQAAGQIKSPLFFSSTAPDVVTDRTVTLPAKFAEYKKLYDVPIYYINKEHALSTNKVVFEPVEKYSTPPAPKRKNYSKR